MAALWLHRRLRGGADEEGRRVTAWVRSLGVDPGEVAPDAVVAVSSETGAYELHLSRYAREGGRTVFDHAAGRAVTVPLVVSLPPVEAWPGWLRPAVPA